MQIASLLLALALAPGAQVAAYSTYICATSGAYLSDTAAGSCTTDALTFDECQAVFTSIPVAYSPDWSSVDGLKYFNDPTCEFNDFFYNEADCQEALGSGKLAFFFLSNSYLLLSMTPT